MCRRIDPPMLFALTRSCADLSDPRVLRILLRSLAITVALFVALALLLAWTWRGADPCGWVGLDACRIDAAASTLGGIVAAALASWLLFPAVALGVLAAFAEAIVAAVERRHYPESFAASRPLGLAGTALLGLRSSGRLLLVNLVMLPLYLLLLLVTGIGPVILFVLVNGWAAGRDFGEMVAARAGNREQRKRWLAATRGARTGIGVACACLFLVPLLNLLAPVIGAAATTHLYHKRRSRI